MIHAIDKNVVNNGNAKRQSKRGCRSCAGVILNVCAGVDAVDVVIRSNQCARGISDDKFIGRIERQPNFTGRHTASRIQNDWIGMSNVSRAGGVNGCWRQLYNYCLWRSARFIHKSWENGNCKGQSFYNWCNYSGFRIGSSLYCWPSICGSRGWIWHFLD